jgi:hypothetical protein
MPIEISASAPAPAATSPEEIEVLRAKLDLLSGKIQTLQENPPVVMPPTATPLPPPIPVAIANPGAANLRSGPGSNYTHVGRLPIGESMQIVGRNSDSTWWLLAAPDGLFAWVSDSAVMAINTSDAIPVVTIPALLTYGAGNSGAMPPTTMLPDTGDTVNLTFPIGTPTVVASQNRRFVQDTRGYKQLARQLLLPTASESFSPHGDQIAITEKIKLYTIATDGSSHRVLLEDNQNLNLMGESVWSPDGQYIAFVANDMQVHDSRRLVGLVRTADGSITYLQPPADMHLDMPRWLQDGRLLVNIHPGNPIHGTVYAYSVSGQSEMASGVYLLSSSHDGQKWFPWQPGRAWQADQTQPTSYYD